MTLYFKNGTTYKPTSQSKLDLQQELPASVFTVGFDELKSEFYLNKVEDMEVPDRTYGDAASTASRIVSTFVDRGDKSTGVLLVGEKGSGKTLLSKMVCRAAQRDHSMPVIIVNQPWAGDLFNSFLQSIEQPCVVLFDEFEKVYRQVEKREAMLTLLDGVYNSRKLFLLTANDKWAIDANMRNRPGRIYYMLEFSGLSQDFIMEYAVSNLRDPSKAAGVVKISTLFEAFNFDMMKALIQEMNRYGETAVEALKFLNIKADWEYSHSSYTVTVDYINKEGVSSSVSGKWKGNPVGELVHIELFNDSLETWENFEFDTGDIQSFDFAEGKIIFKKGDQQATLRKIEKKAKFNLAAF